MHDWNMWWGGGGMWFGPLWMFVWLAVIVAAIVAVVRWLGETGSGSDRPARGARISLMSATPAGRSIATNT